MSAPTLAQYRRASSINAGQIGGWLFMARMAVRRGQTARACEAMLSALWLMGVES